MKKKKVRRPPKGPPNLAARALGSKLFALRVVTPKRGYSRKIKHRPDVAREPDEGE
jgi:hypothetical protein